jgi:hypothetical protein
MSIDAVTSIAIVNASLICIAVLPPFMAPGTGAMIPFWYFRLFLYTHAIPKDACSYTGERNAA